MGPASEASGAIGESVVFLDHFKDLPDPRQRGKIIYPLAEVLLLCLLAVLGGAETFVDIARFGEKKIYLLRRFRPFRDGTPSHDHLGDIFATLDAEAFQRCFVSWVAPCIPQGQERCTFLMPLWWDRQSNFRAGLHLPVLCLLTTECSGNRMTYVITGIDSAGALSLKRNSATAAIKKADELRADGCRDVRITDPDGRIYGHAEFPRLRASEKA